METKKASLMEAYMIETLRSNGVSDEEILIQVQKGEVGGWAAIRPKFDFLELVELNKQDPEVFQSIIREGYQVKFVTFNGLKNLLKFKFGFVEGQHYQLTDKGIAGLQVTAAQLAGIHQFLSQNWLIEAHSSEVPNEKTIKIELT